MTTPRLAPKSNRPFNTGITTPTWPGCADADALAKLPESEREAWRKLWTDVDALSAKMDPAKKP